jgi:mRNA interferase HicA
MNRTELIKIIERSGCILIRHGGKHDWYQNQNTKISQPVPRHREIAVPKSTQGFRYQGWYEPYYTSLLTDFLLRIN